MREETKAVENPEQYSMNILHRHKVLILEPMLKELGEHPTGGKMILASALQKKIKQVESSIAYLSQRKEKENEQIQPS
jgi:hypothetical protein